MTANDRFAERLARIEKRAQSGEKAEYAPLLEHPDDKKRGSGRGIVSFLFTWLMVPLAGAALFAGVFANELSDVLPTEFVSASNQISGLIMDQLGTDTPGVASTGSENSPIPIGNTAESDVTRILLGN